MDNRNKQFELLFVLLLATTYTATAFVLSWSQCIAPPPCTCKSSHIYCDSKSLTTVPHLRSVTTNEYTSKFYIHMNNNNILTIPANVFQNISSVNTSSISVNLDNNMISSIDPLAFTGVEDKTKSVMLRNNQLSVLPSALGKLNRLEGLYLEGNPLVSLDPSVTAHFSPRLTYLHFDMGYFNSSVWPTGLGQLNQLRTLVINFISLNHLPLDAFAGFESVLTSLTMSYSKLYRIPAAVCHLQNLQTLAFDNNAELESNSSVFESCSHNLTRLTILTLRNDSLHTFPDVMHYCPSLATLSLDNNEIHLIQTNAIPNVNNLHMLSLNYNLLTEFPVALNKLNLLTNLDLAYNHITSIEDHDMVGLTNLNKLRIQYNPIEYIVQNAFSHNVQLDYLLLSFTKLHLIPEAVRALPRLTTLSFTGSNVECSCKMSYLKGWNVKAVRSFTGNCANQPNRTTNDGIKQFLLTNLHNCL